MTIPLAKHATKPNQIWQYLYVRLWNHDPHTYTLFHPFPRHTCVWNFKLTNVNAPDRISRIGIKAVELIVNLQTSDASLEAGDGVEIVLRVKESSGAAQNNGLRERDARKQALKRENITFGEEPPPAASISVLRTKRAKSVKMFWKPR